jgi:hypothetical protein
MGMYTPRNETYDGIWEEVSQQHGSSLRGRRVRVQVVQEAPEAAGPEVEERLARFRAMVSELESLTSHVSPVDRVFSSSDIYESSE